MENRITIRTMTTAEDYKTFIFFNMFLKKKAMFYFLVSVGILSLGAIVCRITGAVSMSDWYYYVCLGFWGLLVFDYLVYRFAVKRFLASDKLVINSERIVDIDETGITSKDEKAENYASYKWENLYKAYETKKHFFLYLNTAMALVLPKRDFKAEEIPVMGGLTRDKLGNKFKKR